MCRIRFDFIRIIDKKIDYSCPTLYVAILDFCRFVGYLKFGQDRRNVIKDKQVRIHIKKTNSEKVSPISFFDAKTLLPIKKCEKLLAFYKIWRQPVTYSLNCKQNLRKHEVTSSLEQKSKINYHVHSIKHPKIWYKISINHSYQTKHVTQLLTENPSQCVKYTNSKWTIQTNKKKTFCCS